MLIIGRNGSRRLRILGRVLAALIVGLPFCTPAHGQCAGLHAGITAQFVGLNSGYADRAISLNFLLVNDSDSAVDVTAGSRKILIDGVELPDSDWIFGNGPAPVGGWSALQPGGHYELSKALAIDKYFHNAGQHRVSWRGKGFRSPTITIKIDVPNHP